MFKTFLFLLGIKEKLNLIYIGPFTIGTEWSIKAVPQICSGK